MKELIYTDASGRRYRLLADGNYFALPARGLGDVIVETDGMKITATDPAAEKELLTFAKRAVVASVAAPVVLKIGKEVFGLVKLALERKPRTRPATKGRTKRKTTARRTPRRR